MEENKIGFVDRAIEFVFVKRNMYLIIILLLALTLRTIAASNIAPLADEMNVAVRSIDVHKSGTMNSIDQSHSFYFITEIFYKLTGYVNLITARFPSILFGVLSILLIYLIVMKLYKNEKAALIACFLAAISGFQIRYSLAEMDITMAFFVLLSTYTFLMAIYDKKDKMFYLSALFLSLAVAIKTFAGMWAVSYLAFFIYYSYKNKEYGKKYYSKKGIRITLLCIGIILLFLSPIVIANWLLYKDKGIVDLQVSRFFNINKQTYQGLAGIDSPFMISQLWEGIKTAGDVFWLYDAILLVIAILGFVFTFKKYKEASIFLFLWFIFDFLFISGTAYLETHFVFNTLIFAIFGSMFIITIDDFVRRKFNFSKFVTVSLIIILVVNIFVMLPFYTSKTAVSKMRSYSINNMGSNDLVIVDSRIFRGRAAFMFNDKAYIESESLSQLVNSFEGSSEQAIPIRTWVVECIRDDCGWGTIKDQPELNASVENNLDFFRNISIEKAVIYGGGGYGELTGEPYFRVYETSLNLKPSIIQGTKQTHYHYFYPVGWQGKIYDKYQVYNNSDAIINKLGFWIFYLTIILEVLSPLIIIWFFIKLKKNE